MIGKIYLMCCAAALAISCGADGKTLCDEAADHVGACLGVEASATAECDPDRAAQIIGQDCDQLMASRGKSDFAGELCQSFGVCPEANACGCGEACSLCGDDPDCVETAVPKFCQPDGSCAATLPVCEPWDPCGGNSCGDECTICDPADPDCFETEVIKLCSADGQCEPSVPLCEQASCCEQIDQPGALGNPLCIEGATCCADGQWACNDGTGTSSCADDGEICAIEQCGGLLGTSCADNTDLCVDVPFDGCAPDGGGADCDGMCVDSIPCGGFAELTCPTADLECVDDPTDECDPASGGADCIGTCMSK